MEAMEVSQYFCIHDGKDTVRGQFPSEILSEKNSDEYPENLLLVKKEVGRRGFFYLTTKEGSKFCFIRRGWDKEEHRLIHCLYGDLPEMSEEYTLAACMRAPEWCTKKYPGDEKAMERIKLSLPEETKFSRKEQERARAAADCIVSGKAAILYAATDGEAEETVEEVLSMLPASFARLVHFCTSSSMPFDSNGPCLKKLIESPKMRLRLIVLVNREVPLSESDKAIATVIQSNEDWEKWPFGTYGNLLLDNPEGAIQGFEARLIDEAKDSAEPYALLRKHLSDPTWLAGGDLEALLGYLKGPGEGKDRAAVVRGISPEKWNKLTERDLNALAAHYRTGDPAETKRNEGIFRTLLAVYRRVKREAASFSAKEAAAREVVLAYCSTLHTVTYFHTRLDALLDGHTLSEDEKEELSFLLYSVIIRDDDRQSGQDLQQKAKSNRKKRFAYYAADIKKIARSDDGCTAVKIWTAVCKNISVWSGGSIGSKLSEFRREDLSPEPQSGSARQAEPSPEDVVCAIGFSSMKEIGLEQLLAIFREKTIADAMQEEDLALYETLERHFIAEEILSSILPSNFSAYRACFERFEGDTTWKEGEYKRPEPYLDHAEVLKNWEKETQRERTEFLKQKFMVLPPDSRKNGASRYKVAAACLSDATAKSNASSDADDLLKRIKSGKETDDKVKDDVDALVKLIRGEGTDREVSEGRAWEIFSERLREVYISYEPPRMSEEAVTMFNATWKEWLGAVLMSLPFVVITIGVVCLLPLFCSWVAPEMPIGTLSAYLVSVWKLIPFAGLIFPVVAFAVFLFAFGGRKRKGMGDRSDNAFAYAARSTVGVIILEIIYLVIRFILFAAL